MAVRIIDVSESRVPFPVNHPWTGKDLTFDIRFIEFVWPTRQEAREAVSADSGCRTGKTARVFKNPWKGNWGEIL